MSALIRRHALLAAATNNPVALSIYNKLSQGDWWTCNTADDDPSGTVAIIGARNATSAARMGSGSVASIAGHIGNGISFSPHALYRATTPFAGFSGATYSAGCWVNLAAISGTVCPVTIGSPTNISGYARLLQLLVVSDGRFIARAGNGSSSFTDAATATEVVGTSSWVFLQAQREAETLKCRVNGGSWITAAVGTAAPAVGATSLGGDSNGSTHQNGINGILDESFVLQSSTGLTNTEWDYLYNSGAGISYAALKADAGH